MKKRRFLEDVSSESAIFKPTRMFARRKSTLRVPGDATSKQLEPTMNVGIRTIVLIMMIILTILITTVVIIAVTIIIVVQIMKMIVINRPDSLCGSPE